MRTSVRLQGIAERISHLHEAGRTGRAIATELGVSPSTVSKYLRQLGLSHRTRPRYDWPAIQAYYDDGHSFREWMDRYGFASQTWVNAVARGDVIPRPRGMPVRVLLSRPRNRGHLKGRLLREGLLTEACGYCGITRWRDRPLSLALHHVNGDPLDNRLENLQLLCPNCHSQTANFAGRNRRPG